jgi:hypothetical protein
VCSQLDGEGRGPARGYLLASEVERVTFVGDGVSEDHYGLRRELRACCKPLIPLTGEVQHCRSVEWE